MKRQIYYFAILFSLSMLGCGGIGETRKTENEQKTPPISGNSQTANKPDEPMTNMKKEVDRDADDLKKSNTPGNSNVKNPRSQNPTQSDNDDFGKKNERDSNNRTRTREPENKRSDEKDDENDEF